MNIWGLNSSYFSQFQPNLSNMGFNSAPFQTQFNGFSVFPSLFGANINMFQPTNMFNGMNNSLFNTIPLPGFGLTPTMNFGTQTNFGFVQPFNMQSLGTNPFEFLNSTPTSTPRTNKNNHSWIQTNTNLPELNNIGYNKEKGRRIAEAALNGITNWSELCASRVSDDLVSAGVSNGKRAHGHEYDNILKSNKNFKQIDATNLNLSSLPGGCVLIYERGVAGYSKTYGHVEITLGDGTAASDGRTMNIRKGAKVFVPV